MSRPALSLLALLAALFLAFAGCGGGGGPSSYTLEQTRACLGKQEGVKLSQKVDFVASTALGGAVSVLLERNEVTISFALDEQEVARLDAAYRRFKGKNIGIDDVLRPKQNAVLLWKAHPSDEEIDTVDGCLK